LLGGYRCCCCFFFFAHPWVPHIRNVAWTARDAASDAAGHLRALGLTAATIGVEPLPIEAADILRSELPAATLVDVTEPLEEMRAIEREDELDAMREGPEAVVEAMLATFEASRFGGTEREIVERLRPAADAAWP